MDEQHKLEKAERHEALYGLDDEEEEEEDDLNGFIVYGSEDESIDSRSTGSSRKTNSVSLSLVRVRVAAGKQEV
jgi:hypothetical protein